MKDQANSTDDGYADRIRVKKADAQNMTRRAYIKFDTSQITVQSITRVTLKLNCQGITDDASEIAGRDVNLYAVSSDWTEASFNWNTQPAVLEKVADIASDTFVKWQWAEIDVTDYVKSHIGEVITFSLWNEGNDSENNHLDFNSRNVTNHEPRLIIE